MNASRNAYLIYLALQGLETYTRASYGKASNPHIHKHLDFFMRMNSFLGYYMHWSIIATSLTVWNVFIYEKCFFLIASDNQ